MAGPIAPSERLPVIDVLRGVALFGILVVNMGTFRGAVHPVVDEARFGGAVDRAADGAVLALAQGKFFPLFSFLFGYGLTVQRARARARGQGDGPIARRLVGLAVLGVLHGVLAFSGDILLTYAMAGALLLVLDRCGDGVLRIAAAVLITVSSVILAVATVGGQASAWLDTDAEGFLGDAAHTAMRYRSPSFLTVTSQRIPAFLGTTILQFFAGAFGLVLGLMVVGLLAGRAGLLAAPGRHRLLLGRARRLGLGVGLAGALVMAVANAALGADRPAMGRTGVLLGATVVGMVTAPLLTAGYVAAVASVRRRTAGRVLGWLAPAGRMALTNYLGQSVVCSLLFSGYGLGWYGRVGPVAALALCVALFGLQVVLSAWWLRAASMGPVEWLLRWLTYLRRPALLLPRAQP